MEQESPKSFRCDKELRDLLKSRSDLTGKSEGAIIKEVLMLALSKQCPTCKQTIKKGKR